MRYLLVVGFACEIYKHKPRARIFVGDQLIDEFNIQNHKDNLCEAKKFFFQSKHLLQSFSFIELHKIVFKNLPSLRFYEIKIDKTLDQLKIKIDIKNSDSNYNNGFMSNSTLLSLQVCYFFPLDKILLLKLNEIKNKKCLTQNYAWYRAMESRLFDLADKGMQWNGKNGQIINTSTKFLLSECKIGGDGIFVCNLVKKYGILVSKIAKSYRYNFFMLLINSFLDKYQQYENQRNIN